MMKNQVWEQEGTHVDLQIKISTKWDQLPPTLNYMVTDMQQTILIGYRSDEIIKAYK